MLRTSSRYRALKIGCILKLYIIEGTLPFGTVEMKYASENWMTRAADQTRSQNTTASPYEQGELIEARWSGETGFVRRVSASTIPTGLEAVLIMMPNT